MLVSNEEVGNVDFLLAAIAVDGHSEVSPFSHAVMEVVIEFVIKVEIRLGRSVVRTSSVEVILPEPSASAPVASTFRHREDDGEDIDDGSELPIILSVIDLEPVSL